MKKKNEEKSKDSALSPWAIIKNYFKDNYKTVILLAITFIAAMVISFVKITTTSTISSFNLNDYEVGQIADVTIVATKSLPADERNSISIEKNEKITRKGFPITQENYDKLKKISEEPNYVDLRALANSFVYHLLMAFMFFFFSSQIFFNRKLEIKELITECIFYLIVYIMTIITANYSGFTNVYSILLLSPATLFTLLIAIIFGQLNAVFFTIMISFIVLHGASFQLVPFLFTLSTCLCATRIVRKIDKRGDLVAASLLQGLINVVFILVLKLIFNDSLNEKPLVILGVAANGFISGILCLGLLTPLELLLNTASPFRLMDLSELNNPTMKKMLVSASGTYNHSMMVASLAEAACNEIGANSLLARVGGYYHDIGKLDNPEFFVENQSGKENIHNDLNPSLSVSIIRSHVKKGVEKAQDLHLPKPVVNIISEHHGNQVIAYFYNEAKQKDPNVSEDDYCYTGNPPSTKESAVVMLADTVEAACRTLDKPSVSRLDKFIWQLINGKFEHHQLDNCDLTYKDLKLIHDSFVQILTGYYHSRIEYPDQKDPDEVKETKDENQEENTSVENKTENSSEKVEVKSEETDEKNENFKKKNKKNKHK